MPLGFEDPIYEFILRKSPIKILMLNITINEYLDFVFNIPSKIKNFLDLIVLKETVRNIANTFADQTC